MKSDIITVRINGLSWHQAEFQIPATSLPLLRQSIQVISQSMIDGKYQDHITDTPITPAIALHARTNRVIRLPPRVFRTGLFAAPVPNGG